MAHMLFLQSSSVHIKVASLDDGPKSGRKYLGNKQLWKYIYQFLPNTIKSILQYERINKKICRQKMSIIFNEICIHEEMLPKYIFIYLFCEWNITPRFFDVLLHINNHVFHLFKNISYIWILSS